MYAAHLGLIESTNVQKHNSGGGGSVHVWAGITQFNKTYLAILNHNVNSRHYIDSVVLWHYPFTTNS